MPKSLLCLMALVCGWTATQLVYSDDKAKDQPAKVAEAPKVLGAWTGTWGPYVAEPKADAKPKKPALCIDCDVQLKDGVWKATFEGECGRPYKYTINMEGRQVGDAVLFKGTTDLGAEDGGVYDWIGRATENEFVGFYTSAKYSGVFTMKRAK